MAKYNYDDDKKISALSVFEIILMIILVIMIAAMVICNVMFRSGSGATSILGYSFYRTKAVNMLPNIPVNTIIVAKESEIQNIAPGSVILCNIGENTTLIRVREIIEENGKEFYIVKFDTALDNETFRIEKSDIIAKAVWQLESLGAVIDFATSVPGIIIAVIIPLAIILIFQIVRIRNLRELEREAASLDDIDDMIFERNKTTPSYVTISPSKPSDEITAPLPKQSERPDLKGIAIAMKKSETKSEPELKQRLIVDDKGQAEFSAAPVKQDISESPLFTNDYSSSFSSQTTETVHSNAPTHISAPQKNDYAAIYSGKKSEERVVFTPHLSNIIPEDLLNIQESAPSAAVESSAENSTKTYFEKPSDVKAEIAEEIAPVSPDIAASSSNSAETITPKPEYKVPLAVSTIPENAVIPKENIAPVKKKKNSKTLAELMSLIDAEETKLKK